MVSEQNLNSPLGTFDENEKVTTPPQSRRGEEFQKKTTIHYKPIPKHLKKIPSMLLFELKDNL
jgi:hypothetical protein